MQTETTACSHVSCNYRSGEMFPFSLLCIKKKKKKKAQYRHESVPGLQSEGEMSAYFTFMYNNNQLRTLCGFHLQLRVEMRIKEQPLMSPQVTQTLQQNTDAYTLSSATINQSHTHTHTHFLQTMQLQRLHFVRAHKKQANQASVYKKS